MIVVRPPPDELPHPTVPTSGSALFPLPLLKTTERGEADALAARLRGEGATVAVIEELPEAPTTCQWHPPHLLGRTCAECGVGICAQCRLEAGGDRMCPVCDRHRRQRRRNQRLRQLFAIFLFSVFLYEVVSWQREENRRLDPETGITVAVFQFTTAGTGDDPAVVALNQVDGPYSLLRVQDWYRQEYERFTGRTQGPLRMRSFGPWPVDGPLPSLDHPDLSWWRQLWVAWRYAEDWHDLARAQGAEPDDWDVRVYVVYGRGAGSLASESRGSNRGRIAVSHVALDESNPAYAQLTIAHEVGHVLGAEDLYDPDTYLARMPLGFAEPNRSPVYPQRYAELMAVDRPLSATTEVEVQSLDQVRIGYHTAARMGWIEADQAALHYARRREVRFGPEEASPAPPPDAPPPPDPAAPDAGAAPAAPPAASAPAPG